MSVTGASGSVSNSWLFLNWPITNWQLGYLRNVRNCLLYILYVTYICSGQVCKALSQILFHNFRFVIPEYSLSMFFDIFGILMKFITFLRPNLRKFKWTFYVLKTSKISNSIDLWSPYEVSTFWNLEIL